jgi:hypothetical protein
MSSDGEKTMQWPAIAVAGLVMALLEDDEEEECMEINARVESVAMIALQAKRALDDDQLKPPKMKREYIRYDRERARMSVVYDYLGPQPIFPDHQFERFFRITRPMAQLVLETCCRTDSFLVTEPMQLIDETYVRK